MGFPRQEYWSGLPFPYLGDLPNPGMESSSPALQVDSLLSEPPGKPRCVCTHVPKSVCMHEGAGEPAGCARRSMVRDYGCVGAPVTQAHALMCAFVSQHLSKHMHRVSEDGVHPHVWV